MLMLVKVDISCFANASTGHLCRSPSRRMSQNSSLPSFQEGLRLWQLWVGAYYGPHRPRKHKDPAYILVPRPKTSRIPETMACSSSLCYIPVAILHTTYHLLYPIYMYMNALYSKYRLCGLLGPKVLPTSHQSQVPCGLVGLNPCTCCQSLHSCWLPSTSI